LSKLFVITLQIWRTEKNTKVRRKKSYHVFKRSITTVTLLPANTPGKRHEETFFREVSVVVTLPQLSETDVDGDVTATQHQLHLQ